MIKMAESKVQSKFAVIGGIGINMASSVLIIQINKYIYVYYGYPNMALTCLHFIFTFIGLLICQTLGVFTVKRVPIVKMLPMAISFCGFVVLTNYSLQFNTIGTYQCFKVMTTPIVLFITMYFYNQPCSLKVRLSVVNINNEQQNYLNIYYL